MVRYDKPLGIALLTFFLFLSALIIISVAMYVFFYEDAFPKNGLLQGLKSEVHRLIAIIIVCVLIIISGIGLLKASPRGRGLLIGICILGAIQGAIVVFSNTYRGLLLLVLCLSVIAYMFTERVSAVFQPIYSRKAVDAIEALESYRRSRSYR